LIAVATLFCNVRLSHADKHMEYQEDDDGEENVFPFDKELVFIVKMHEILVTTFEVSPVAINLREDPDIGVSGADFILDYDLGFGEELSIVCRREGGNMTVTLFSNDREIDHTVPLDEYVDDDFMPVADEEFTKLVHSWFE
jgi:hypothetical protein